MNFTWRIEVEDEFGYWNICSKFSSQSRKKVAAQIVKAAERHKVKSECRFRVVNESTGDIEIIKRSDLNLKRETKTGYWGVEEKRWPRELIAPVSKYLDMLLSEEPVDHWRALNLARVDGKIEALMTFFSITPKGCFEGPIPWNDCLAEYFALEYKPSNQIVFLDGRDRFIDFKWLRMFSSLSNIELTGDFSDATIDLNEIYEESEVKIKSVYMENAHIKSVRGLFSNEIERIFLHRSYVSFLESPQDEWGENLQSLFWSQTDMTLDFRRLILRNPLESFGLVSCPIPNHYARLLRRGFNKLTMDGAHLSVLIPKIKALGSKRIDLDFLGLEGETYLGDVQKFVRFLKPRELELCEALYDELAEGKLSPEEFIRLLPPPPCKITFGSYDFGPSFFPKESGYIFR